MGSFFSALVTTVGCAVLGAVGVTVYVAVDEISKEAKRQDQLDREARAELVDELTAAAARRRAYAN